MARFNNGWFRVDRRLINEDIGKNVHTLAVFITLLGWACRFETKIRYGGQQKILPIGSVALGIRELANHLGTNKDAVYRALKYLQKRDTISVSSDTHGTIVTICNFRKYQEVEEDIETLPLQQLRHGCDTDETPLRHAPTLNGQLDKETIRQRNKKTNVGIRAEYPRDFDEVWVKYGRRGDKKAAYEVWKTLTLTEVEIAMLHRSIDRYAANNEWKYRKHLCRYLKTDWREVEPVLQAGNGKTDWNFLEANTRTEGKANHG